MPDLLDAQPNYSALSIKDLLRARDLYHYHLLNRANVVGTAVGLQLIDVNEPYPDGGTAGGQKKKQKKKKKSAVTPERTFTNSEVRDYSLPCVLVLVRNWVKESAFGLGKNELSPQEMIPKTLYMPDGRAVPVCVVKVTPAEASAPRLPDWHWPSGIFGGGMPIVVESQQRERLATVGCLVTDGHTIYAVTSRHVSGEPGERVFTVARGRRVPVGVSSKRQLTRLPFTDLYPEFQSRRTYINLDVGLLELADANQWTSQIFGLGNLGPLADLNELNITLRLIDTRVVAAGAASGRLEGRIKALFYRYKSVGGYDYISDFLIAPRWLDDKETSKKTKSQIQPGDSGAIWHLVTEGNESKRKSANRDEFQGNLRPLAVQWGGQTIVADGATDEFAFALASSLTSVCKALDVELLISHNTGVLPYWGQMGHYSIAYFACQALRKGKLKSFLTANIDRISFSLGELTPGDISKRLKDAKGHNGFVPLADVPDVIWKNHYSKIKGGRDTAWREQGRSAGPEHPTHYADIDLARKRDKLTLRKLCKDPHNISVPAWQQFYDDAGYTESRKRGLLPFRVWQFFDAMVTFAKRREAGKFLCAAGIVSHYVGDACQPLHGSIYADGYEDRPTTAVHRHRDTGKEYTAPSHVGKDVHSTYESKMIDRYAEELIKGTHKALVQTGAKIGAMTTGHNAAVEVVRLMERSADSIPPRKLIDAYVAAGGKNVVAVQDALWEKFGKRTCGVMADGARVLAKIWQAAWNAGNGDNITGLGPIATDLLVREYSNSKFVESLDLDHIERVLS